MKMFRHGSAVLCGGRNRLLAKTGTLLVAFELRWTVQGPQSTTSKRAYKKAAGNEPVSAFTWTSSATSWPGSEARPLRQRRDE